MAEKRYSKEDLESLIDQTKEKISRARVSGNGILIEYIVYGIPKAMVAYNKRKISKSLENSKVLLADADPILINLYGDMLREELSMEKPYRYPILERDQSSKKQGDSYFSYMDQTVRGCNGLVIRNCDLGINFADIKYA